MSGPGPKALFVGALTRDTLYRVDDFSRGPGKYITEGTVSTASGMAANAATAAARLGGCPALWASVGGDALGPALIAEIAAEGVDCSPVRRVPGGRSASATIIVDGSGERWVLVDYDPVTQRAPEASELPDMSAYAAAMVDVRWPEAARIALTNARAAGLPAVLDADVAPKEILEDLSRHASHVVASAPGAAILTDGAAPEAAAARIAETFGCFACVTDGAAGSFFVEGPGLPTSHIPNPVVEVIDTNGAGDVFHGAFTQALAEGQGATDCIRFASAAAALKCTVLGGRLGAPNRKNTLKLMDETYHASR
ncbi:PfkB family carbohydrate kinase [Jannaschia seohaensis]|uniref:Sulfofructose kinase n=1 Tax=Jannaschia seohaensis TaxID=475081 RepID=A0A2Y9B867_9RHOB|nr:PfkB family carbohydrate kinase [Jannaschia seohaensis]PWJ13866.1 sulfofructose kinase [Jannaschia seohaensis]SSA50379.1 sulfofructose kinase [Jannaschia seohaensis]